MNALLMAAAVVSGMAHHPKTPRCPLPSFTVTASDVIVRPTDFLGWAGVLAKVTGLTRQILLTPGDYRSWGPLDTVFQTGWPDNLIVRYYNWNDNVHPFDRRGQGEAVIHGVQLFQGVGEGWTLHGLTIREPNILVTSPYFTVNATDRVLIDGNLVEDSAAGHATRMISTSYSCVQRNVYNRNTGINNDSAAIAPKPVTAHVIGLKAWNNTIIDWNDGIVVTNGTAPWTVSNFEIIENEIYVTPYKYRVGSDGKTYSCTENGIDLKATGSTIVARNRIYGFREYPNAQSTLCTQDVSNSGSAGDAILVHFDALGPTLIVDNDIYDSVSALRNKISAAGRQITFRNNRVWDIPGLGAATPTYGGAAFVVEDNVLISGNAFRNVPRLCPAYPWVIGGSGWSGGAPPNVRHNNVYGYTDVGVCAESPTISMLSEISETF